MKMDYTVATTSTGYVKSSIAALLSRHNNVHAVYLIHQNADFINRRKFPVQDEYIEKYLAEMNWI